MSFRPGVLYPDGPVWLPMRVRDAVAGDAEAVGAVTGAPTAAARELLRARTVRVAEDDDAAGGDSDGDGGADAELVGVVAFDAGPGVVQVTRLAGTGAAMERLLEEPLEFAARETMVVELLVPADDAAVDVARRLDAAGHAVSVVSPDVTETGTAGRDLVGLERASRIAELRRATIPVVDWEREQRLAAALTGEVREVAQ